jgi:hypothetical protein
MSPSIRLLLRHRGAVRAVREVGKYDPSGTNGVHPLFIHSPLPQRRAKPRSSTKAANP